MVVKQQTHDGCAFARSGVGGTRRGPAQKTVAGKRLGAWLASALLSFAAAAPASAQIVIEKDGWKANINGLISVWSGSEDYKAEPGRPQENSVRVRTGFNPSKLEVSVAAPESNGLSVSSYFQIATSVNGSKTQRAGEQIEIRGADISVGSQYGTLSAGRSFGIYGSLAIVNDTGSMRGVGYLCTGPDGNGPNCGHIGTGYTWSDFTAGIRFASPRVNGFQVRVGSYEPIEAAFGNPGGGAPFIGLSNGTFTNFTSIGSNIETSSPMFQGDISWASGPAAMGSGTTGTALIWIGGLHQHLKDISATRVAGSGSTNIKAFNAGTRLTAKAPVGVFGLTANYEKTWGVAEGFMGMGARCNARGCDATKGEQWFVNTDFNVGATTVGASYGRGTEDANFVVGNDNVTHKLAMVYLQQQLTPNLNANIEVQRFVRNTGGAGNAAGIFLAQEKYTAALLGLEYRF